MLLIKNATTNDIPLIRELTMQVWPQTYTPIVGKEQVQYMLDRFYNPTALQQQMEEHGHQFIIGYCDDEPVAFASYALIEPQVYKLHKLYIIGGQQSKGVGKAMVAHIMDQLNNTDATMLRLNVNKYNTAAKTFYEKNGFTVLGEEDIDIGSGYFMNDYILGLAVVR